MKRPTPYNYSIGSPCANNTGYCDFFQYCQRVDLEGPLLQLFNLYFTEEGKFSIGFDRVLLLICFFYVFFVGHTQVKL